jgi:hypothetical protein
VNTDGSTNNLSFGESLSMSNDGNTLVISSPGLDRGEQDDVGAIYIYKWNTDGSTNTYTLQQTILSPETETNMRFGSSVQLNKSADRLVIGAENFSNRKEIKFDNNTTTFDLQDTQIVDLNIGSGGAFTATKYDTEFVIDDKLVTNNVSANDNFGKGVCIIGSTVFVGAPEDDTVGEDGSTLRVNDGSVTVFDLKELGSYAWKELVSEKPLVDNRKIESSFIFDSSTNKIIDYLDYYDPIKGRILGVADREINYKTEWDPAIYNVGISGKTVSVNTAWGDEHIGEVWWDMSTVRWIWYEQNDQEYKTKNWGKLFPGSTVDIYEWVSSTLLPSEWNARADSAGGLAQKISGKPLYPNNNVFTVKQKYDSKSDSFINVYYYWIKNSVFLPATNKSVTTRNNTTSYISNIITNPMGSGIKYFAVSDTNKLITFNIKDSLINNNTVLNVNYRNNENDNDQHSIWKLIREGDKDDRPNERIEKKWWDSLIGEDTQGNEVPDLNLPLNQRYGNHIRPRQSWYVDRFAALKEIVDYSNNVLKANQLANSISYINLNSADPEPTAASGEWNSIVDTYADLTYIDTRDININNNVLVKSDEKNSRGFWAIYLWTGIEWIRTKVQNYKTSVYYNLADWYDNTHSVDTIIDKQVTYQYELDTLTLAVNKHVKVLRADTGGWKIFQKTTNGFKNVGTQNGTIQLSKALYDYSINNTGFDGQDTFDNNFFDQEPTLEIRKILTALRDDIFVGDLKAEYNNIFFIGLRKVLEEQLYVDWLSKTSFINVTNSLRPLDQRKTYKIGTDDYVESYINEVKPYHTKIREYKLGYTGTDTEDGINTDFDLPAFYDGSEIRNVDVNTDVAVMATYPYRFWRDNYKKYIDTITVTHGGSGYITAPTVTLVGGTTGTLGPFAVLGRSNIGTTSGQSGYFYPLYTAKLDADLADTQEGGSGNSDLFTFDEYAGIEFYMPAAVQNIAITDRPIDYTIYSSSDATQATARAIINSGSVVRIQVLTHGSNYTATPTVIITGGGVGGNTPADAARGYANLRNDLVRDIQTTIKFDRVQSTASVQEWAANTAYAYNELIRYENELYKVTASFISTEEFKDGLTKLQRLRGDETYITAAERTLGLYTPASGMPGNELSQVMTGVDYGGVMVTGLAFSNEQGWDRSPWYSSTWDNYGIGKVKTFYGDGSTMSFTFNTTPTVTDVYTLYYDGVRQISDVFRGDGSTKTFTVTSAPAVGVKVEFIPFDDDKTLTPTDDRTLDTLVSGGLFRSVLGIAPSDIILEGDGFVTPETSYAPEENVPGSMFDTVDIKVYTTPESGVPFIIQKNYIGDGATLLFPIGQTPGTQASVIVSVDGTTQTLGTDYNIYNFRGDYKSVDYYPGDAVIYQGVKYLCLALTSYYPPSYAYPSGNWLIIPDNTPNNSVVFVSASVPAVGSTISIKSFAVSGSNYMVLNAFEGDGSTKSFSTSARENFQLDSALSQLYVTVDGQPTTDYTTSVSNKLITITFNTVPTGAIVIAGFNQAPGSGRAYAEIRSQQIIYDGSTTRYSLTYPAGSVGPYSGLTLLELNGKILRGPDNTYYAGDGSTTIFSYGNSSGINALSDDSTIYTPLLPEISLGEKTAIDSSTTTVDSFVSSDFNSAWYLSFTKDATTNELSTAKYSLVHDGVVAFVSSSSLTKTGTGPQLTVNADISGGDVRLRATGSSSDNSISFSKISLGDNTVANTNLNSTTILNIDVDSAVETLDSWNKTLYRGAKYFISVKNSTKNEMSNTEAVLVHDGIGAYISQYNNVNTGNSNLVTLSADISGDNVRLLVSANEPNCTVTCYRILLSDNENSDPNQTSDANRALQTTIVDSSATRIDSFQNTFYTAAHYVVVSYNSAESSSSISEVTLIHDSADVYINATPHVSTKGTDQLSFSASLVGNNVSLYAASSSGANTIVNAYRVAILKNFSGPRISANKLEVYVNGFKKDLYTHYLVNSENETITFINPPAATDIVAISTLWDNHYYNEGGDIILKTAQISADGIALSASNILVATTFNNALGMNQRREVLEGRVSGEFYLQDPPLNSDYVFVWLNNNALTQNFDFTLSGNKITVIGKTILTSDRLDVMYFALESATNATGFRIFKDMLNRTFYKRISKDNTTTLAADLHDDATTISLIDGSRISTVDGTSGIPGVIFIDKERIEYFVKSSNTLSQLRRGTLGTGVRNHVSGTQVVDASGQQTVPYAETIYTKTSIGDGSTKMFSTSIAPVSPRELDVFVGGQRLPYMSEDSSTINYTVDGSTANVVLSSTPAQDVQVKIIQKRGQVWYTAGEGTATDGKGLQKSTTNQAKFIAGEPTNAPE